MKIILLFLEVNKFVAVRASVVGLVDKGICNKKNDDRLMIGNKIIYSGSYSEQFSSPFHCIVCDGVGGAAGGDKAAEYVLQQLSNEPLSDMKSADEITALLENVNDRLFKLQEQENLENGMKTTIVGAGFYDDRMIFYNSGDSRLYRLRNGILFQLSEDHSIVEEMILGGIITENTEEELRKCSQITRCLGAKNVLPPYTKQINIAALENDIYLLCSDGLWGVVPDEVIEKILKADMSLEEKRRCLFETAEENDSNDNISIIIIQIK